MANTYTVAAVSPQTRDYGEGSKANRVYYVKLNEAQPKNGVQAFELHKRQTSKPPEPGHKLDVKTFQEGNFNGKDFVKLILDYGDRGGRSGSGGGDGPGLRWKSAPYERGAEHPRNEVRMIHTAALSATPDFYRLLREENFIDKPKDKPDALRVLTSITQWLADSYPALLEDASGSPPKPASEVPVDTDGLNPAQSEILADVPFS